MRKCNVSISLVFLIIILSVICFKTYVDHHEVSNARWERAIPGDVICDIVATLYENGIPCRVSTFLDYVTIEVNVTEFTSIKWDVVNGIRDKYKTICFSYYANF